MTWFLNGRGDRIRTCDLVLMPKRSHTEDWVAVEDLDYWDADPATIPKHVK